ncbi:60S ribosomal protein L18a-like protein [Bienertia sinuspersici]
MYYSFPKIGGYVVAEGTPVREHHLPCCGIGWGWFLFIIGFILGGIPWYIGAIFLMCCKRGLDHREKPGYIACTIAAVLALIATLFGVTKIND